MKPKNKSDDGKSAKPITIEGESGPTTPDDEICRKAPEWAEHSRLQDEDEPCDDGRSGTLKRTPQND